NAQALIRILSGLSNYDQYVVGLLFASTACRTSGDSYISTVQFQHHRLSLHPVEAEVQIVGEAVDGVSVLLYPSDFPLDPLPEVVTEAGEAHFGFGGFHGGEATGGTHGSDSGQVEGSGA